MDTIISCIITFAACFLIALNIHYDVKKKTRQAILNYANDQYYNATRTLGTDSCTIYIAKCRAACELYDILNK